MLLMPTNNLNLNDYGNTDKLVHVLLFGVLAYLIVNVLNYKKVIKSIIIAVFAASSYGFLIECLQGELNTGRYFDYFDIIANISGSLIGSIIFYLLRKIKS